MGPATQDRGPGTEGQTRAPARRDDAPRWRVALPYFLIAVMVTVWVLRGHAGPRKAAPDWVLSLVEDRWAAYALMAWTSLPVALLACLRLRARGRLWLDAPLGRRVTAVVLGLCLVAAGLNYGYIARVSRAKNYVQQHDSFHYTLAPKYLSETGYEGFYECVLITKAAAKIANKKRLRDLRTYTNTKVKMARKGNKRTPPCAGKFSDARWASFEADLHGVWSDWRGGHRVPATAIRDNGYNGTPLHAFVMGRWAHAAGALDVGVLARMALLDVWAVCAMGWCLCLAFGWRVGMVASIFFFVNAADRFDIVGGSPGRYLWMAALGIAVAALARRRWASGGALLTLSTALVALPFLFWFGAGLSLWGSRIRGFVAPLRRFALGCLVSGAVCFGLGAAHTKGLGNYSAWAHNMSMHTGGVRPRNFTPGPITSTPGFGLGLKFVIMRAAPPPVAKGRMGRIERYRSVRRHYWAAAVLLTAAAAFVAARLRAAAAAVFFGLFAFYALQGTVGYYFTCAGLIPLLLVASWRSGAPLELEAVAPSRRKGRSNARGLASAPWMCAGLEIVMWVVNAYALFHMAAQKKRGALYTLDLSFGLGLWFALALVAFAWMVWPRREASMPAPAPAPAPPGPEAKTLG